jgi:hypothetical protein
MDFTLNLALGREGEIALLKAHALMKALPEGFVLKSHAVRAVPVDPALSADKILEVIGAESRLLESIRGRSIEALFRKDSAVLLAHVDVGVVRMEAIASDESAGEALQAAIAPLEKYRFENEEKDGVWIDLTYQSSHGVARNTEFIRCPEWAAIKDNYPGRVRGDLARLMEMEEPWKLGRLVIWHGPTGTGKTFALRALLMAWRKRFDFLFVTDPEKMTATPAYYYELAGESSVRPNKRGPYRPVMSRAVDFDDGVEEQSGAKRSLFIFEDSADLIITESRSKHYDKIGKLLNMTDGLLGQGRQDLFLVTFNEQITDIDPAFLRPGRCAGTVQFEKFKAEAARDWLADKGGPDGVKTNPFMDELTLAELYARLLGRPLPAPVQKSASRGF